MLFPSWQRGNVISLPAASASTPPPRKHPQNICLQLLFLRLFSCIYFSVLLSVFCSLFYCCLCNFLFCLPAFLQLCTPFAPHFSLAYSIFLYLSRQRLLCTSPLICMHSCSYFASSLLTLSRPLSAHISFIAASIHCTARQQKKPSNEIYAKVLNLTEICVPA